MRQRDRGQGALQLLVGERARGLGIAHHRPQRAQRQVGHLRRKHHRRRQRDLARGVRPQTGQALQQRGLAHPGAPGDQQRLARPDRQLQVVHQHPSRRGAHLHPGQPDRAVGCADALPGGHRPGPPVGVEQSVQTQQGGAKAGERVIAQPEERQAVVDGVEGGGRLHDIAERDLAGEQPLRLHDIGQRIDGLAHRHVPAEKQHHPVQPRPVVAQHAVQSGVQVATFGALTPVQAHPGRRLLEPDHGVPESGVAPLVGETQIDERTAHPERDDGRDEDVAEHDPEQCPRDHHPDDVQRPGQVPQDDTERRDGEQRFDRPEQQDVVGAVGRIVGFGRSGGDDVDVGLDALIGVVDTACPVADEPAPVVRVPAQPVVEHPVGQPAPPADQEPLRQVQIDEEPGHEQRRQNRVHQQRIPELPDAGVRTLEGQLQRGEQVVGVVADQHRQPDRDDHRQQHRGEHQPDPQAAPADEVATGDPPELPAPLGAAGDRGDQQCQAQHGHPVGLQDPQRRMPGLGAPVDRGAERRWDHRQSNPVCVGALLCWRRSYRSAAVRGCCDGAAGVVSPPRTV